MKKIHLFAMLLLVLAIACKDDDENVTQPENEVRMNHSSFLPVSLTVSSGITIQWFNSSSVDHTVTSNDGLFNSLLSPGARFSYTFNNPGSYSYVCTLHPGMTGTINVE